AAGAGAEGGVAVAAAAHGHGKTVLAGGADRGGDLRRRADLRDGDGRVVAGGELPGRELGEPVGVGTDEPTVEGPLEVGESSHRWPHFRGRVRGQERKDRTRVGPRAFPRAGYPACSESSSQRSSSSATSPSSPRSSSVRAARPA